MLKRFSGALAARSYPLLDDGELAELSASAPAPRAIQRRAPAMAALPYSAPSFYGNISKFRPVASVADIKLSHTRARLAARVACFDSLLLRAIVERLSDLIIGAGLRLECIPDQKILGRSPEQLDEWGRSTEDKFDKWLASNQFSIDDSLTGYQAQRLALTMENRDGEYFGRVHYLGNEIKFGFIDPDQVVSGLTNSGKGHDGVITGPRGEEVGYNIRKLDGTTVVIPATTYGGDPLILHGYMPDFAGQTRGISRLAHCLEEANRLSDYELAELYASASQSQMAGFVKPSVDSPSTGAGLDDYALSAMPSITNATVAQVPQVGSDTQLPSYSELPEYSTRHPGAIWLLGLGAGETLETVKKTSPTLVFPAFFESIAQYVSASLSIPLSIVKMLFSENYSASRGELQLFWKVVQVWRAEITADLLQPLFIQWLNAAVARGDVECPGYSDRKMRAAWTNHKWYGDSLPQLDPEKQANADRLYVEMGATTLKRVAQEYNGSDAATNRAALRRELSELTPVPWNKSAAKGLDNV
jgi:capsid protein